MNAEDPLFILYTSGSTGKPKGIVHSTGGYLLGALNSFRNVFDNKPNDIFWCTADVGWITGHSYVCYGPLANGATQVIFEGVPTYPDPGRIWRMIQRHKINVFYTSPTLIRSLTRLGDHIPNKYDLSSLRLLGSVGEPINPSAWMWFYEVVGKSRCPIVDTWWQTETGSIMLAPIPGVTATKPGSCTLPLPGIMAEVLDENGQKCAVEQGGALAIKRPFPSMLRTIWNDPERYKSTYFLRNMAANTTSQAIMPIAIKTDIFGFLDAQMMCLMSRGIDLAPWKLNLRSSPVQKWLKRQWSVSQMRSKGKQLLLS